MSDQDDAPVDAPEPEPAPVVAENAPDPAFSVQAGIADRVTAAKWSLREMGHSAVTGLLDEMHALILKLEG